MKTLTRTPDREGGASWPRGGNKETIWIAVVVTNRRIDVATSQTIGDATNLKDDGVRRFKIGIKTKVGDATIRKDVVEIVRSITIEGRRLFDVPVDLESVGATDHDAAETNLEVVDVTTPGTDNGKRHPSDEVRRPAVNRVGALCAVERGVGGRTSREGCR